MPTVRRRLPAPNHKIRGGHSNPTDSTISPGDVEELFRKMGTRIPESLAKYVKSCHLSEMFSESVPKRTSPLEDHFNAGFLDAFTILGAGIDLVNNLEGSQLGRGVRQEIPQGPEQRYIETLNSTVLAPLKALVDDPQASDIDARLNRIEAALCKVNKNNPVQLIKVRQPAFEKRFNEFIFRMENHLRAGEKAVRKHFVQETIFEENPDSSQNRSFVTTLHDLLAAYEAASSMVNLRRQESG